MGRPPGSKNAGAKKAAAKTPSAKKGAQAGNGTTPPPEAPQMQPAAPPPAARKNGPSPQQNQDWLARLTRLKTESRRVAGEISALGTEVKGAGGALHWKNLKKVHDLQKMDPSEAVAELEGLIQIAAQNEIRVTWAGNQATLADVLDQNQPPPKNTQGSRDLDEARAHSDGYNSGKNGSVPSDNPFQHAPGSLQYVAWHNGRDEGQKDREKNRPGEAARVAEAATADDTLPSDKPMTADDVWPKEATKAAAAANDPAPPSKITDSIF